MDSNCRIHRESIKQKYMGKPHNLVEFIKAYLTGGRVTEIQQVENNRIIKISILNDEKIYFLLIRLWGGFPNIIITSEDYKILHLHKKSSKKEELPGMIFQYPESRSMNKSYILKSHNYPDYNSYIEAEYKKVTTASQLEKKEKRNLINKEKRIKEITGQLKRLTKRLSGYANYENYKLQGDLILSNIHLIKKGDETLSVTNYLTDEPIDILLDPKLKPEQNSALYFKKYQKGIHGLQVTKKMLLDLENERKLLENNQLEVTEAKQEQKLSSKKKEQKPGLHYKSGSWEILVGRSAKENENLLRKWVKGNDMWLHVRDYPGGYVFIRSQKNKTIPLEVLKDAGNLSLFYSKGKNNGKADITYTQVKHLRRVKNGKPGQVIPSMDKNLYVTLDKNRLDSIKP